LLRAEAYRTGQDISQIHVQLLAVVVINPAAKHIALRASGKPKALKILVI
jgi:hypothetical protein